MELMITVVIVGILAAVAVPGMAGWFGKKDLDSVARAMFSHFQLARSDAVRNSRPIQIRIDTVNDWYDIRYSNGDVIVSQTSMPQGIDIELHVPALRNDEYDRDHEQGFGHQQGEVRISSANAPTADNVRIVEMTLGGTVKSGHEPSSIHKK
ncbi:MAG: hypothetical protein MZV49_15270 [Rhodopseudomonas palustris]|nr:hypothetical protein [Rhodopseudomonas palustris]